MIRRLFKIRRLNAVSRLFLVFLMMTSPALAQDALFDDDAAMRAEMDRLIRDRNITELMLRFGAGDERTPEQLSALQDRVQGLYPEPLTQSAVLRRVHLENGFTQELIAYWHGFDYLYAYVFYHRRETGTVAINFRLDSNFATLNALF